MGALDQCLEILHQAVFGIDAVIIGDGIWAAQRAFAVKLADRMDGHQPQHVNAQVLDARQVAGYALECALRAVAAHVDLVDDQAAKVFGCVLCHKCPFMFVCSL